MVDTPGAGPIALEPNKHGYLAVTTESGTISCLVQHGWIGCETSTANWPRYPDGTPCHGVKIDANGSIEWMDGQIGDLARTKIDNREYSALGWKITSSGDGLLITNQRTGKRTLVSTDDVQAV